MGPFPALKHRFGCHPQFHGSGNRGSESSSGVQGHTREAVELGHELGPGSEPLCPRPHGKPWGPQGRLVERRRREARGSGRLPGGGVGGRQPRAGRGSQQGPALDGRWVTMKGARRGPEPSPHSDEAGSRAPPAPACIRHQRRLFKNCMFKKCLPLSHTPAHPVFAVKAGDCGSFSPNGKGIRHDSFQVTWQAYRRTQAPRPLLCLLAIFEPFCGGEGLTYEALVGTAGLVLGGIFQ